MSVAKLNVNLSSISKNLSRIRNLSDKTVKTAAVVKANAYGLGVDAVAKHLYKEGVRIFFVSSAREAVELRLILPSHAVIYYLNGYSSDDFNEVSEFNIVPVLNSIEQIESFKNKTENKLAALQIDIGMKRLGLNTSEVLKAKEICKSININLILGHLSSSDDERNPTNLKQLSLFSKLAAIFPNTPRSLAATGGIILGKQYHFNLTRPGIGIFGGKPLKNAENVVSVELPILQIKNIKKNDGVGYNHSFISPKNKKIAIVGAGYADGLPRNLSNNGTLYAGKSKCPILGRVSMDLITVDISNLKEIPKSLSVLSPLQSFDDLAENTGTIGYEILTNLGSRYKRVYHY